MMRQAPRRSRGEPPPDDGAKLRFLGVRGSVPAPGAAHLRVGGDTPCVEISTPGRRILIDAGSGIRHADHPGEHGEEIEIILSHYHYDHLIGLPFFAAVWRQGVRLRIHAPQFGAAAPADILARFFAPPFCPVTFAEFAASVEVASYRPGESWMIDDMKISTMLAAHPGGSAAIRVSAPRGDIVYASDVELADAGFQERLADFSSKADLMIADAMNNDENATARRGWGHSTWREAIALGTAAKARRIALFHHDPEATDDTLAQVEVKARGIAPTSFLARQGETVALGPG